MRVTQSMLFRDGLSGMQSRFRDLQETQKQSLSGNRVNRPADDPAATFRHMIFSGELSKVQSLVRTTGVARSRLELGEAKVSEVFDNLLEARQTILQLGNDYMQDDSTMEAIAAEMLSRFEDVFLNVNSEVDGVPLFGGARSVSPFSMDNVAATKVLKRGAGQGVVVEQPASAVTTRNLDTTNANYPGAPASVRMTYDAASNSYQVLVGDQADPASPAVPAGGVVDLGWVQVEVNDPPVDGDQLFFDIVPAYQGGAADRPIKTAEGQVIQGNITGKEFIEGENGRNINIFGVLSGLRGALQRGDSDELAAWLNRTNEAIDQASEWQAVTGIRTAQVDAARETLQLDEITIQQTTAENIEADMFEVLSKLEQTNQAMQVLTMSERTVYSVSLVDLLR